MKELFVGSMLKLVAAWREMVQTTEYNLVIIEEEQVPLAPGDALGGNSFLTATLIGMSILPVSYTHLTLPTMAVV